MDEADESRVIKIAVNHEVGHLWNPADVHLTRAKHRIVGVMVGSLPRHPHQSSLLGLPLRLMPEEVTLMLEKGIARAVVYKEITHDPSAQTVTKFNEVRENCYKEQIVAAAEHRKREIERMADTILQGKINKLQMKNKGNPSAMDENNFGLTREKVIEIECEKIQTLPENHQVIQIFTEHPMIESLECSDAEWSFPTNASEKLRYEVFKDLWEKGYYITTGVKFGGDFLVYKGDPILYHAAFIVRCVHDPKLVDSFDMMTLARLGNSTKKTVVLASLDNSSVFYKSFQLVEDKS